MAHGAQSDTDKLLTPANIVTMVRICLVPVFVLVFLSPWPQWLGLGWTTDQTKSLIAAGLFILISCTDWVDGYLARSRGEVTDFGKFMDPLADKILVAAALLALVELSVLPSWPVLIILVREFIVSGIRMIAATKGEVIAASWYGKAKTVFQIVAIVLFIVKDSLYLPTPASAIGSPLYVLSWVVMLIALVLTVVSMLDYLSKARHILGFSPADGVASAVGEEALSPSNLSTDALRVEVEKKAQDAVSCALAKEMTVGTAESLTGGLIAGALTSVAGSSAVVRGGIVSYVNEVKSERLGVDAQLLADKGAVEEEVAKQMARGACAVLGVDVAVAVTGIAGPGGEEPGKPVGTVWIGCCAHGDAQATLHHFAGNREEVRLQTVSCALDMLVGALKR